MTIEEAMKNIKILENINSQLTEYLRKYQDIGTLEELRKLKEKRISKEVNGFMVCGCTMEEYDAEIRAQAIEEFLERFCNVCCAESMGVVLGNRVKADMLTVDGVCEIAYEIAEAMKGE